MGPPPLTPQEKVNKAIEGGDSEENALFKLKDNLSKLDKSNIWSQYQTLLKHNKEEKDKYEQMSNLDKGNAQTLWFIKKTSPKFFGFKMDLSATGKVTWKDKWCSHKEMLEKFGSEELDMHITSGRLLWREDPLTKGVYQYKDQGALSREVTLQKGKHVRSEQEWEPSEDQENHFKSLYDSDLLGMLGMTDSLFQSDENSFTLVKEKGKRSGETFDILGKGKRPKNDDPKPRSEGEQLEDAITKCKNERSLQQDCPGAAAPHQRGEGHKVLVQGCPEGC